MKKKKKTLYIRRIRVNLKKRKSVIYLCDSFVYTFNGYFRRKSTLSRKRSFVKFLNKFELTNITKALNFIKNFGMCKSYKIFNFEYKSKVSKRLFLKFKKKRIKLIKRIK